MFRRSEIANSRFDYPLSSQFDEIDSMIVFDDVFVPWDQVFIYRDVDLVRAQFNETGSHVLANFQSLVRFGVKLDFSAGLAKRLADIRQEAREECRAMAGADRGDGSAPRRMALGEGS